MQSLSGHHVKDTFKRHPALSGCPEEDLKKIEAKMKDCFRQANSLASLLGFASASFTVDATNDAIIHRFTDHPEMARMLREIEKSSLIPEACSMMRGDVGAPLLIGNKDQVKSVVARATPAKQTSQKIPGRKDLLQDIARGMINQYGHISADTKSIDIRNVSIEKYETIIRSYLKAGYQSSPALEAYLLSPAAETYLQPLEEVVATSHAHLLPFRWNCNDIENPAKVKCHMEIRRYLYKNVGQNRSSRKVKENVAKAAKKRKKGGKVVQEGEPHDDESGGEQVLAAVDG
jgi:hypothetical protein